MTDRRSAARRFLEVELVLAILALRSRTLCLDGPHIHQAPGGAFALAGPLSPGERHPRSYRMLVGRTTFAGNLLNSFIIAAGAAALGLGVSIPAAYAFSRFRFRARRVLMTGFLVINMFPVVLLIIPLFILMKNLGLLDTFLGVISVIPPSRSPSRSGC